MYDYEILCTKVGHLEAVHTDSDFGCVCLDFLYENNFIAAATNMANIWKTYGKSESKKQMGKKSEWPNPMFTHNYAFLNIFNFQLLNCVLTSVYLKVPWSKTSKTWRGWILPLHRWSFFIFLIIVNGLSVGCGTGYIPSSLYEHYLQHRPHHKDQPHHQMNSWPLWSCVGPELWSNSKIFKPNTQTFFWRGDLLCIS